MRRLIGVVFVWLCLLVCGQRGWAAPVYINDPNVVISSFGGQIGEARLKADNVNWDLALGPSPGSAGRFVSSNLGNSSQVLGRVWEFSLLNDPAAGLSFSVKTGTNPWVKVDWGLTPLPTLDSLDSPYNTIRISARATGNTSLNRRAQVYDLGFSLEGSGFYNAASGLNNLDVNPSTPASSLSNFPNDSAGSDSNWIATGPLTTGTNMAALAWRLRGKVRLDSNANPNPNESVRMSIGLIQYNWQSLPLEPAPPQIPEPETYLLMASGLGVMALIGRSRLKGAPKK